MKTAASCSHCLLPVGRLGQRRELNGEALAFCCYGCCLAYQVHHGEREEPQAALLLVRIGVGAFLAMNIMLFSLLLYSGTFGAGDDAAARLVHWVLLGLASALLVLLGGPFFAGAWRAARAGAATADTLVSAGSLAAYGYSAWQVWSGSGAVYFDTLTMVLMLFTVGRYLEALGRVRAARSLAPMLAAERAEARVVSGGAEAPRPVGRVAPGDLVRILPGERIPVDGLVLEGRSECDESVLSGQALPQAKAPGLPVHAGSLNGAGQLLVRASAAGGATRWAQMGRRVREALARKSLLGQTVDRLAAAFVPAVLLLAAAVLWYWSREAPFEQALLTALAVLVVACPCSLGLAAPLSTTLGIALAAQRGILLRSGGVLERLARVRAVALDKTGTLTEGRPRMLAVAAHGPSEREVLARAAALARASDHPLARAIAQAGAGSPGEIARDVRARPGAGLTGAVRGERAALGSAGLMAVLGWPIPSDWPEAPPDSTLVYVGWAGRVHGRIALGDRLLPEAAAVMGQLRARGLALALLSGDREAAVAQAATALGVPTWRSALMPEDKVDALRDWARRHGPAAMLGDGLNDGPVLAAAEVGIAVGGADLARESADVVLPERALALLPWTLQLAARVRAVIWGNLAWALGYNAVALALAACGLLQPVLAAGLMAGSSLVVVLRSLNARRGVQAPLRPAAAPIEAAAAG